MADSKTGELLIGAAIRRGRFFRRFFMYTLATAAALGALYALDQAAGQGLADRVALQVGAVVAVILAAWFGFRALLNFWRWLVRPSETVRVFERGIAWSRRFGRHQYGWSQLRSYQDGGNGVYLFGRPVLQWGALRLTMRDGRVFQITRRHGDLRRWSAALKPVLAEVMGTRMGRLLREGESIRMGRQLSVVPDGVKAGKAHVPWSKLDVKLRNGRLTIFEKNARGRFEPVKSFNARRLENVGGFLEVVSVTLPNHQRERFAKKRTGPLQPRNDAA